MNKFKKSFTEGLHDVKTGDPEVDAKGQKAYAFGKKIGKFIPPQVKEPIRKIIMKCFPLEK